MNFDDCRTIIVNQSHQTIDFFICQRVIDKTPYPLKLFRCSKFVEIPATIRIEIGIDDLFCEPAKKRYLQTYTWSYKALTILNPFTAFRAFSNLVCVRVGRLRPAL